MDLKKTYAPIFEVNLCLRVPSVNDSPEDPEGKSQKTEQSREESLLYDDDELEFRKRTVSEDLLSHYNQPCKFSSILKRILSGEAKGGGRQLTVKGEIEDCAMLAYLLRGAMTDHEPPCGTCE